MAPDIANISGVRPHADRRLRLASVGLFHCYEGAVAAAGRSDTPPVTPDYWRDRVAPVVCQHNSGAAKPVA